MTEWQPIETAPYDKVVLFLTHDGNVLQDFWYDEDISSFKEKTGFTHWRPLPEPPKDQSK